jgi:hypothetical protein
LACVLRVAARAAFLAGRRGVASGARCERLVQTLSAEGTVHATVEIRLPYLIQPLSFWASLALQENLGVLILVPSLGALFTTATCTGCGFDFPIACLRSETPVWAFFACVGRVRIVGKILAYFARLAVAGVIVIGRLYTSGQGTGCCVLAAATRLAFRRIKDGVVIVSTEGTHGAFGKARALSELSDAAGLARGRSVTNAVRDESSVFTLPPTRAQLAFAVRLKTGFVRPLSAGTHLAIITSGDTLAVVEAPFRARLALVF